MLGVDSFNCYDYVTVDDNSVSDTNDFYAWIPYADPNFDTCWENPQSGVKRFNFHKANIIKYMGVPDDVNFTFALNYKRMLNWGFNALTKFNDVQSTLNRLGKPLPYIKPAWADVSSWIYPNNLPDMWASDYVDKVEDKVRDQYLLYETDPYYIGMMNYQEYYWGTDANDRVLAANATPAKNEFIDFVAGKYLSWDDFKIDPDYATIGQAYASFAALKPANLQAYEPNFTKSGDLPEFIRKSSERFYKTWKDAIDKYDPGRLFLGSCLIVNSNTYCSKDWIEGSLDYIDALNADFYTTDANQLLGLYITPYAESHDLPVILGEYNLTTTDRGFLPYGTAMANQLERGRIYDQLMKTYFASPYFVGCGWFQLTDQPLLGRDVHPPGGERYNTGLIDYCDQPYYDMVDQMKETNKNVWSIHKGQ